MNGSRRACSDEQRAEIHRYLYVCLHVCMFACMYMNVCMYVYTYVSRYVRVCLYVRMYVCMNASSGVPRGTRHRDPYVCMCVRMYMYVCGYWYKCVCTHVCVYQRHVCMYQCVNKAKQ